MKTIFYVCGIIVLGFLLILCQESFGGGELTREKAKEIIIKECALPLDKKGEIPFEARYYQGYPEEQLFKNLHKQGLALFKIRKDANGNSYMHVTLTPKGEQYFTEVGDNVRIVRIGKIIFGEITGIFKPMPTIANVEFTLILNELTPFASCFDVETGSTEFQAGFVLYDDGWRMVENSLKKK